MIGTSLLEYAFIHLCIWGLRAILPLSCLYIASRAFWNLSCPHPLLDYYAAAEVTFFLLVWTPLHFGTQRPATHPPLAGLQHRQELFNRCFGNIGEPDRYLRKWFKDAPLEEIKEENVREYLSWAFFNAPSVGPEHRDEMDRYLGVIESHLKTPLKKGRGNADCLKLTLDKVNMVYRPLIWYIGAVFIVDLFVHVSLTLRGYVWHRSGALLERLAVFPPRPQALFTSKTSPSDSLSYWYRPHNSKTHLPILFLHGIGIGPYPYMPFLSDINAGRAADDQIGVIAIEILPISFRITKPILRSDRFAEQIRVILAHHGFKRYILASHSYGSVLTTHMLKNPAVAPAIAAVVLIDPVSIMLHMPAVAYNFVYRTPRRANEWQLYYFASTDPCVAHTLGRSFFWAENILWKDDLRGKPLTAALAGEDLIVDTCCVAAYLTDDWWRGGRGDMGRDEREGPVEIWEDKQQALKILWSDSLDHAQVFDVKANREVLVRELLRHSREQCSPAAVAALITQDAQAASLNGNGNPPTETTPLL